MRGKIEKCLLFPALKFKMAKKTVLKNFITQGCFLFFHFFSYSAMTSTHHFILSCKPHTAGCTYPNSVLSGDCRTVRCCQVSTIDNREVAVRRERVLGKIFPLGISHPTVKFKHQRVKLLVLTVHLRVHKWVGSLPSLSKFAFRNVFKISQLLLTVIFSLCVIFSHICTFSWIFDIQQMSFPSLGRNLTSAQLTTGNPSGEVVENINPGISSVLLHEVIG